MNSAIAAPAARSPPRMPVAKASEAEQEFWDGVKDSTDADEIALYVEQFPNGAFVALAQKRIAELSSKKK